MQVREGGVDSIAFVKSKGLRFSTQNYNLSIHFFIYITSRTQNLFARATPPPEVHS